MKSSGVVADVCVVVSIQQVTQRPVQPSVSTATSMVHEAFKLQKRQHQIVVPRMARHLAKLVYEFKNTFPSCVFSFHVQHQKPRTVCYQTEAVWTQLPSVHGKD